MEIIVALQLISFPLWNTELEKKSSVMMEHKITKGDEEVCA